MHLHQVMQRAFQQQPTSYVEQKCHEKCTRNNNYSWHIVRDLKIGRNCIAVVGANTFNSLPLDGRTIE